MDPREAHRRGAPWFGLLTRSDFLDQLHERFLRDEGPEQGWLAFIDLDKMKWTNDRFGRAAGEARLALVADVVRRNAREPRLGTRFFGKVFLVWVPEATEDEALVLFEALQWDVSEQAIAPEHARRLVKDPALAEELVQARFTVTVGLSPTTAGDRSYREVLKRADLARARAKEADGNGRAIEHAP